jgi:hypothetical protein
MAVPDPLQRCFLAEWYRPAVVNRDIDAVAAALGDAVARLHAQGYPIRLLAALAAPADQVLYGLFAAESPDTVTQACRSAGWPADRISTDVHTWLHPQPS